MTRNIVDPLANIHDKNSLNPPRQSFFSWCPPFQNLGLKIAPPAERGETDTVLLKLLCVWRNRSIKNIPEGAFLKCSFKTANKHVLIPSYVIQVIWQNQCKTGQDQHLNLSPQRHFIFKCLFLTRNIVDPLANIHDKNSLNPPRQSSFSWCPPFLKFGTESCTPSRKGGDWYSVTEITLCLTKSLY